MASLVLRINPNGKQSIHSEVRFIPKRLFAQTVSTSPPEKSKANMASLSTSRLSNYKGAMIGPAHPVSNLRPIIWYRSKSETQLEQKLRNLQEETQSWNQNFWQRHNANFHRERKLYIQNHLPSNDEKQTLTADEMSNFYKEFLDKNWKSHTTYNFHWYKKNFSILFLSIAVQLEKLFQRS